MLNRWEGEETADEQVFEREMDPLDGLGAVELVAREMGDDAVACWREECGCFE